MKAIMITLVCTVLAIVSVTFFGLKTQAQEAHYFRAWQGFKKPGLSNDQFMQELPSFMKDTVDIYYGRGLNNYMVVIPPKNKPDYVPDEFALVALTSEDAYRKIRETEEGKAYGARHWDVFNKDNSASSKQFVDYQAVRPENLDNNWTYDMIGQPIDWSKGYSVVYIGTRQGHLSKSQFLDRLNHHLALTKDILSPFGLNGYIVLANEDYEIAYMNWESREAHDTAIKREEVKAVLQDSQSFADPLMYQQLIPFVAGNKVSDGAAYSSLYDGQPVQQ